MISNLFFSPNGRLARRQYWLGFVALCIFVISGNAALRALGFESMLGFFLGLIFPFLTVYMFYNLFAKRLHDFGCSVRPFFVMIALELVAMIVVMLIFGGAEYFAEFSQYSPDSDIDPAVAADITARYQERMKVSQPWIEPLLMLVPMLFAAWTGLSKPDEGDNAYGSPAV